MIIRSIGWSERFFPVAGSGASAPALDEAPPRSTPFAIRMRRLARRASIAGAVGLLVLAAGLLAFRLTYQDRLFPGVSVAGVAVGGRAPDDASALLAARVEGLDGGLIRFTYADRRWTPSFADLGIRVSDAAALEAAYRVGRESTAWDRLATTVALLRGERTVPLGLVWDTSALDRWFDQIDADLGSPPKDATLTVEGDRVTVVPERDGLVVDRRVATERIRSGLIGLRGIDEALPVATAPAAVRAADLAGARATLERALAKPVEVVFEGRSWTLQPEDLGRFVVQRRAAVGSTDQGAGVALDEQRLARWLADTLAAEIDRDPVDAVVGWNDGPVALEPSVDGVKLRPASLAKAVARSFLGDHAPVEAPVSITPPRVDSANLGALGITAKLAVGDSNYEGSGEARATNIRVGATLLNGTLVPPGEEFSFNRAVGVISEEAGFVEAAVIDGERIGRDIGGGICQVSTTVFRAALLAGLPITEWWPHRYRLDFYERDGWTAGYDASILQPEGDPFSGGDFKFRNPTDSWMLVESWSDGARVFVIIYGPDLGYEVKIGDATFSDPIPETEDIEIVDPELPPGTVQQTELAQPGVEATFERSVYDRKGSEILADTWRTRYEPKGDVWKVSPDMEGQSPAATAGH